VNIDDRLASTRLRNPMPDQSDEGLKIEIALLYRRLILLETMVIKYCAALELATGIPWDSSDLTNLDDDGLEKIVAKNLAHGLRISIQEAYKRIRANQLTVGSSQAKRASEA
jgi:hypothetical protein